MRRLTIVSWNIQWGRGVDGRVDLARMLRQARDFADFDVLCLQEVSRNYPALAGSGGADQPRQLARLLPGYTPVFCAATDAAAPDGGRRQFGNMILSRLPLGQSFCHLLPWPGGTRRRGMQRAALEVVAMMPCGPLRVLTTHLEYYSATQRADQVARLRALQAEAAAHHRSQAREKSRSGGPFQVSPRPASAVLCGDFNCKPEDALRRRLSAGLRRGVPGWRDAWRLCHPRAPHPPTLGVHDRRQWPQAYCSDYLYVTADLAPRVLEAEFDAAADASDHQPGRLVLDARR